MSDTFTNEFQTTTPTGASQANQIDTFINAETKKAINERMALEHVDLETGVNSVTDFGGQGRHKAGYVGVLGVGNLAARNAITEAGLGALFVVNEPDGLGNPANTCFMMGVSGWEPAPFGSGAVMATPAEVEAGTSTSRAINPSTLKQSRTQFVEIHSGSHGITQNTNFGRNILTWSVADFANSYGTLIPENVEEVLVSCTCRSESGGYAYINAEFPGTVAAPDLLYNMATLSITQSIITQMCRIPINDTTAAFSMDANISTGLGAPGWCSYTMYGVTQRTQAEF